MENFLFKKNLENTNCSILLSLNGIYHGLFKPTILLQQNILPFHKNGQSRYNFFQKLNFSYKNMQSIYLLSCTKILFLLATILRKKY